MHPQVRALSTLLRTCPKALSSRNCTCKACNSMCDRTCVCEACAYRHMCRARAFARPIRLCTEHEPPRTSSTFVPLHAYLAACNECPPLCSSSGVCTQRALSLHLSYVDYEAYHLPCIDIETHPLRTLPSIAVEARTPSVLSNNKKVCACPHNS